MSQNDKRRQRKERRVVLMKAVDLFIRISAQVDTKGKPPVMGSFLEMDLMWLLSQGAACYLQLSLVHVWCVSARKRHR